MLGIVDKAERAKLKQRAVDVIVSNDYDDPIVSLAEALERCVDELDKADQQPHCGTCTCGVGQ